ncbi:MAG: glycosyltransferase family 87 protein [Planctomycetota bacterium]
MSVSKQRPGECGDAFENDRIYRFYRAIRQWLCRYGRPRRVIEAIETRDPFAYSLSAVLLVCLAVAFSVAPLVNSITGKPNKDYDLWQRTGQTIASGGGIYPTDPQRLFPFMYPPAAAVMMAPVANLPKPLFVATFLVVQSLAWGFCIYASVRLTTGHFRRANPILYLVPSLMVIPFVSDMYLLGQPAVLLLAISLGAFMALRRKRPEMAGFLVATAAAMKAYPIILSGYFIYRREVRATAGIVLGVAFYLMIFPLAYRTGPQASQDLRLWANGMLFKYDNKSIGQRPDRSYSYKNQSLQATVHRLSRPVLADGERDRQWRVNLGNLNFRQTNYLMMFCVAGIGLFTMWAWWGKGQPVHSLNDAANCEQAMSLMLTVMMAPLSFNYSYVWLIFPFTFLLSVVIDSNRKAFQRRSAARTLIISVGFLMGSLVSARIAAAYANIFMAGFVAFVGIGLWERRGTFSANVAGNLAGTIPAPHLAAKQVAKARDVARG